MTDMEKMEELAQAQFTIGKLIDSMYINFKKDSRSRKTSDYLQQRLKTLNENWDKFEATDTEIRTNHPEAINHTYFTTEYYTTIQDKYDNLRMQIESLMCTKQPIADLESDDQQAGASLPIPLPREVGQQSNTAIKVPYNLQKFGIISQNLCKLLKGLPENLNQLSGQFYKLKIGSIEKYWNELQKLYNNIWADTENPMLKEDDIQAYFNLEELVQQKLIQLYDGHQHVEKECKHTDLPSSDKKQSAVKLPKVVLPKFEGDYLKWRQFRDLFTELVHNQDIADCHKMWYLKTSLLGEAEKLIRHFTICEANYKAAWKVINERYENKRLLVNAFISKLLAQPNQAVENTTSLKMLHDTTQECLLGLQNIDIATTHWDPLLLYILIKKLDRNTHALWEQSLTDPRNIPSFEDFLKFLENRFQSLEALGNKPRRMEEYSRFSYPKSLSSTIAPNTTCAHCKGNHQLFYCSKFLQLSPSSRSNVVRTLKLCSNCLKYGHLSQGCTSRGCSKCSQKHNTLLHVETRKPQTQINLTKPQVLEQPVTLTTKVTNPTSGYVLLGTVLLNISSEGGNMIQCRAILDSGSQLNFITEKLARLLKLPRKSSTATIEGIGQQQHKIYGEGNVTLASRINGYTATIQVHILPKIISAQPAQNINTSKWNIPKNLALADPRFHTSQEVDLLIGAELYPSILSIGQVKLNQKLPCLQNTVFGWTVLGKIHSDTYANRTCAIASYEEDLNRQLEKFWQLEEVHPGNNSNTRVENQCEEMFRRTHKRDEVGSFVVRLPFKDSPSELGDSKHIAYQRFLSVERKLVANPQLQEQYIAFMEEYEKLGHMKEINFNNIDQPYYFLPHHAVVKPESSTTKVRVVFDGSAKTSTGASLNNLLHIGPTIQDDVFTILLRFRMPKFVFTADIEKMYRQIMIDDDDQKFQLIWWRKNPKDRIKCFQLTTVTYGTACAPYLAIRCLKELAASEADRFPLASRAIDTNFYVDDVLSGSNSLMEAIQLRQQLQTLLEGAGFSLRKWCANHSQLLKGIPDQQKEVNLNFDDNSEEHVKTMGLIWCPGSDSFRFRYRTIEHRRITKRTVASDIAHLYDPLGVLGPIIIVAKLFSQTLWQLKTDWDAALPQEQHTFWKKFKEDLHKINNISIPRHALSNRVPKSVQLHIFTDASEKAYGAAAYLRAKDKDNIIIVRLLCAKSKVAPINKPSLPRLELCAAKLGAELAERIKRDLALTKGNCYFWADSEITLAWIHSVSSNFHTFVANRVARIQELTLPEQWRHVSSKLNPADLLTRGTTPDKLKLDNLWFYGPSFLHGSEEIWPTPYSKKETCTVECKRTAIVAVESEPNHFLEQINHGNSFRKLQRIVAMIIRFTNQTIRKGSQINKVMENEEAIRVIISYMQRQELSEDIQHLQRYEELPKSSNLTSLSPFIDNNGIMRVGGRLETSSLSYNAKHPMFLPYKHPFTKLILSDIHKENHHASPQTLLALARQRYWPLKGKTLARSVVQHCVFCSRAKPKLMNQLMGNLPTLRVQPARPFVNSGVDFCGPVWTHFKVRGKKPQKAYIAVFCCFSTKAVHLELVTDLTTEGFIGALKRFTSRRGNCRHLHCDNATNFVGAKNQLQEVKNIIESTKSIESINELCTSRGTQFHLMPPRAPHFGGLWEAAVKSAKSLLKSTLTSASLTYEEMETVVTEVEAILNSRPITPMSTSPNDLTALTPGHFLIGEPITATVDAHAEPLRCNVVTRWKLVASLRNEFWRRWHGEYLNQLQHRVKWQQRVQNITPNTMVIIKEDNQPPLQWKLGRIIKTYPGEDGLVRVTDVRTVNGILRRPIHRLAPLPVEVDGDQETSQKRPPENETTEEINPPKRKPRTTIGSALLTFFLTCMIVSGVASQGVKVQPFKRDPGLYFENIGPTNIIASEWTIVAFYDMQPYWKEPENNQTTESHQFAVSYLSLILICMVIGVVTMWKCKLKLWAARTKRKSPKPLPRTYRTATSSDDSCNHEGLTTRIQIEDDHIKDNIGGPSHVAGEC